MHNHSNGNELRILMQIKLISLTIVEHKDSRRNRDKQQLGNGPFIFIELFAVETWLVGFALQRVKKKRPVSCRTPLREQHNAILKGAEKSWRNGSSDGKINVQCQNLMEWPVSNASTCRQIHYTFG